MSASPSPARWTAAAVGPIVVGAVELLGLILVPVIVRASGCGDLDCLLVGLEVLAVTALGCLAAAVAVLSVVARRSAGSGRSPARTVLVAGGGGVCWLLLAVAVPAVAFRVGGLGGVAKIVVGDAAAVLGTVGVGYLAVAAVRRGGRAFGWFVTATVAAVLFVCAAAVVPNLFGIGY